MKQALAAKAKLKLILADSGVKASCGVTRVDHSLALKLNISEDIDTTFIPTNIQNVKVIVEYIGETKFQNSTTNHF